MLNTNKNLSFTDSIALITEYKKSNDEKKKKQLLNIIALIYMPIIKKIAFSVARRNTDPIEDIIQVGYIGFIKALEQYNVQKSDNFKAYASYFITGEIRHYIRDYSTMIRAPRAIKEIAYRINKLTAKLTEEYGHTPTDEELAKALQIPEEKLQEYKNIDRRTNVISADETDESGENPTALIDQIPDNKLADKEIAAEDKILLQEALAQLDQIEQDLIHYYYYDELNYQELAIRLNISQKQVAHKLQIALDKLFKILS